jgi:hypothetical protein
MKFGPDLHDMQIGRDATGLTFLIEIGNELDG